MTNGRADSRHARAYKTSGAIIPPRAPRYVRVRELEEGNSTKVRLMSILRPARGQFDTSVPLFAAATRGRRDAGPVRHTNPNVCGRFSGPAHRHRSAACL